MTFLSFLFPKLGQTHHLGVDADHVMTVIKVRQWPAQQRYVRLLTLIDSNCDELVNSINICRCFVIVKYHLRLSRLKVLLLVVMYLEMTSSALPFSERI
jgi:hypothetical protein